jgi:hypothetical protein
MMWRHKVNCATLASIMPLLWQNLHARIWQDANLMTGFVRARLANASFRPRSPSRPPGRAALRRSNSDVSAPCGRKARQASDHQWREQRQAVQHAADHRAVRRQSVAPRNFRLTRPAGHLRGRIVDAADETEAGAKTIAGAGAVKHGNPAEFAVDHPGRLQMARTIRSHPPGEITDRIR